MEIASLGLAIDSTQVKRATVDLDQLALAGGRAEEAGRRTSVTYANFSKDMSRLVRQVEEMTASQARQERMLAQLNGSFLSTAGAITRATGATTAHAQAAMAAADALGLESRAATSAEKAALAHARAADAEVAASRAIQGASASAASALNSQAQASKNSGDMLRTIMAGGVVAFLGGSVVRGASDAAKALYDASAAAQRLGITLNYATGGSGAREIEYITRLSNRLGLELVGTATAYASFAAAARGTTLEGQQTRAVFEAVSKASAVMGLSAEQSSGALLALQQMVSKGVVSSEELRGQLAERLPSAFQIAARSMNVSTAELGKMLELGLIPASEFLPKFAAQLEKELGGAAEKAADRLDASVNRISNSWNIFKKTLGDSGIGQGMANEYEAIARDVNALTDTMDNVKKSGGGMFAEIASTAGVAAGRTAFSTLNFAANTLNGTINLLTGGVFGLRTDLALLPQVFQSNAEKAVSLSGKLAEAEAELRRLKEQGAADSPNFYIRNSYFEVSRYIDALREAKREMNGLGASTGAGRGSMNPQTAGQLNAAQEEWDAKVKKYLNEDARQSKPQIRDEEIAKANTLNKKLVDEAKARGDVAAATRLEAALKVELASITDRTKDKTPGAAAALNDGLNSQVQAFRNADKAILDDRKDFEAAMALQVQLGQKGQLDAILESAAKEEETWTRRKANFDAELAAAGKKKNSLGEVQRITGQLQDAERDHAQAAAKFAADEAIYNAKNLDLLGQQAAAAGTSARAALEQVRVAGLEGKQIGVTGAALGALRQARVEDAAAQLEAKARTQDGLDLSGETSKALRTQAQAVRDLAKANGANESAAMVREYARSVKEANDLVQFELSLSGESQRDRQIAIAQYQVAVDLKKRLADIDAKNPADSEMATRLKSDAEAAAAQAKATAATRVQIDEWNRAVDTYDDIFRKGFASMVNNGQDTWKSFTRSLATTFKTTVADAIYRTFAQKFVVNMVGNVLGMVGLGGAGIASAGGAENGGGAGQLISAGSTGYKLGTGSGIYGAIGSGFSQGVAATFTNGGAAALSTGASLAAEGSLLAGLSQIAGVVAPYAAAAAAIYSLFKKGSWKTSDGGYSLGVDGGMLNAGTFTEQKRSGGLFGGSDKRTTYGAIDAETGAALQKTFDGIKTGLSNGLSAVGLDFTKSITGFVEKSFDLGMKDLSPEQQAQRLASYFSDVQERMTQYALGANAGGIGREGETAVAALTRVVGALQGVNPLLDVLGAKLYATTLAGGNMASSLQDAFGGLEKMQTAVGSYYEAYYSESERVATTTRQLTAQLRTLGVDALPASRDAWRALVEAQDLTTESGRNTYAALIGLSGAFAGITPAISEAAAAVETLVLSAADLKKARQSLEEELFQAQNAGNTGALRGRELGGLDAQDPTGSLRQLREAIYGVKDAADAAAKALEIDKAGRAQDIQVMELLGNASGALAAKRADELAAMDPLLRARAAYIYSLQDEATAAAARKAAVDTALQSVSRSVEAARVAENDKYQKELAGVNESIGKFAGLASKLRGTLDGMSLAGTESEQRASAQSQLEQLVRGGGAGSIDADRLSALLSTVSKDASSQFSRYEDYALDYAKTANSISALADMSDASKTIAERQLGALNANHAAELATLDGIMAAAQAQVDAVNGVVHTDLLTIDQSLAGLGTALAALRGTTAGTSVSDPSGVVSGLYKGLLGRDGDAGGASYWKTLLSLGSSVSDITAGMMQSDEYKARVYSAPAIASTSSGSSNAALEALVSQLIAKTSEQSDELREIRLRTTQTAETLSDAARGTQPLQTATA